MWLVYLCKGNRKSFNGTFSNGKGAAVAYPTRPSDGLTVVDIVLPHPMRPFYAGRHAHCATPHARMLA